MSEFGSAEIFHLICPLTFTAAVEGIIRAPQSVVSRQKQQRGIYLLPESANIRSDTTVYEKSASSDRQAAKKLGSKENHANREASQLSGGNLPDLRFYWDEKPTLSLSDIWKAAHSELDKQRTDLRVKFGCGEVGRVQRKVSFRHDQACVSAVGTEVVHWQ